MMVLLWMTGLDDESEGAQLSFGQMKMVEVGGICRHEVSQTLRCLWVLVLDYG